MIVCVLDPHSEVDNVYSLHTAHQWVWIGCIHDQYLTFDSFHTLNGMNDLTILWVILQSRETAYDKCWQVWIIMILFLQVIDSNCQRLMEKANLFSPSVTHPVFFSVIVFLLYTRYKGGRMSITYSCRHCKSEYTISRKTIDVPYTIITGWKSSIRYKCRWDVSRISVKLKSPGGNARGRRTRLFMISVVCTRIWISISRMHTHLSIHDG